MQRLKTSLPGYTFNNLMMVIVAVFLTACGGGGLGLNSDPIVKKAMDVTSVTVQRFSKIENDREVNLNLIYGGKVTVTINGSNLDAQPLTVRFQGCSDLVESPGGTDIKRIYTCTLKRVGYLSLNVLTTAELSQLWVSKIPVSYPQVTMYTSMGKIIFELDPDKAPATVDNFLRYVNEGFYVKTIIHRVISANAIFGGSLNENLQPIQTHEPINLENTGMSNLRGTIAMAHGEDRDSATAQFFINVADNRFLDTQDGGYAVFGNVVSEMEIIDAIKEVETQTVGAYVEVPVKPIMITSVEQTQ